MKVVDTARLIIVMFQTSVSTGTPSLICCYYIFVVMFLGIPAVDVLRRGLSELTAMCEHMLATFEVGLSVF